MVILVLACQVGRNVFRLQRKMKAQVWAAWLVKVRQSQRLSMMMESHRRTFRQRVACTFVALRSVMLAQSVACIDRVTP